MKNWQRETVSIVVYRLSWVDQVEAERKSGADSERFPPPLHSGRQWGQDEQVGIVMGVPWMDCQGA